MPENAELDSPDRDMRQRAIAHVKQGLEQASRCGVDAAYVMRERGSSRLDYFGESMLRQAADLASERQIALGIEHFPGKALPPRPTRWTI